MKKYLNSRGSIWRKWDLHVHSPASKLHNEFTSWDEYFSALENLSDISVLGVTDYYSIEGYLKVLDYKKAGGLTNIDLILPNVELRIDTVTARERPINFHVIFSPKVVPYIEDKFFRELKYEFGGRTFSCTVDDFTELGKMTKGTNLSSEESLKEGMNQFKVSIDRLREVLQQNEAIFAGNYITIVANKSNDGASGLRESSMQMEQRKIYQFADAIFSSRPKDREFFLGKAENHPKDVIIEKFGSLKPCIHGSDAHKIEKIGKPDQNRFTWIKADPTFEGLMQIIHEPEKRVLIQEDNPDSKNDYNVIESICFKDDENFSPKEIKLNPDLNTIIGGKSSGKSLLLYKIAQSISRDEVKYRSSEEHWRNPYINSFIEDVNFEVRWRNGDISTPADNKGKVTYIPQMYINSLSEDTANADLQKKIKEVLVQNNENAKFLANNRDKINKYTSDIKYDIVRLFEKIDDLCKCEEDLRQKGNKEAIKKERDKLAKLIEQKVSTSNLSQDEEIEMKKFEGEKENLLNLLKERQSNNEISINVSKELNNILDNVNSNLKDLSLKLSQEYRDILDELLIQVNQSFLLAQNNFEEKRKSYTHWKKSTLIKIEEIDEKLKPYLEKLKGLTNISELRSNLQEQENLLKEIEIVEKKKEETIASISSIKQGIYNTFECYFETLKEVRDYFNDKQEFSNFKLKASIVFDLAKFEDTFLSIFNRRGKISNLFPQCESIKLFDDNENFLFDEENYINKIKFICDYILSADLDKLKLKKSFTKQQAVEQLLNTSFTKIIYDLEKDGDKLTQMSPGKKGLVLIELFLEMSDERHPILIDQPEDNLDNRTISKELVEFIRNKKEHRQIIIVTHNANLVALTDAENVIIANQDLQLRENQSHRFEYLSGAIECDFIEKGNHKMNGKGIKSHICEILEGGKEAFEIRERKYGF
ncbi:TrlF family AAA-like ATPase [Bacillus smithii]|uniref:TrlF family AAA-like ATPase n=1 Tax=Bacillus smithii TaxID=1479 RepID=UPI003D21E840